MTQVAEEKPRGQLVSGLIHPRLTNIGDKVDLLLNLPRIAIGTGLPDPEMDRFYRKKLLKYLFQLAKLEKVLSEAGCTSENLEGVHYELGRVIGLLGLKD